MKHDIKDIFADYRQGKMIILMDDESRENEGDLMMAAEKVNAEAINFMATYGRGLICLTLMPERCRQLGLPLMVHHNATSHHTNFTTSIEAAQGVTTGISASDRAKTVLAAVTKNAKASDIVQPGHIFPLMSKPGGVLTRAGHTEAGCDLARIAGFEPASVIVEILNADGSMARRKDLEKFSEKHGIKLGTVEDLIRYRIDNEKTVIRLKEHSIKTKFGQFKLVYFMDTIFKQTHLALVKGKIEKGKETLVRVHMENTLNDVFFQNSDQITVADAMRYISDCGNGVFVLLRRQTANGGSDEGHIPSAIKVNGQKDDFKTYGLGAQILFNLGVSKMKILGSPRRLLALKGFDLEVLEYIENLD